MNGTTGRRRTLPPAALRGRWSALRAAARDRLALMTEVAAQADAVTLRMGSKTLLVFNRPEYARHVLRDNHSNYRKGIGLVQSRRALGDGLLTSEGERWRRQRALVQPLFAGERLSAFAPVVAAEASRLGNRWRERSAAGAVDMVSEMTGFTLGVLGKVLLNADLRAYTFVEEAFAAVQQQAMFEMVTLGLVPHWLPLSGQRRFRRARAELDRVVDDLVGMRAGEAGDDLVSTLLADADREPGVAGVRDELITLMLAGHETTASTLSWLWLEIDRHPEVAGRLRAESERVLGGRPATAADMPRLTYTMAVVHEVMRLHPPVWILPRTAVEEDEIGGYHVPAGADVLICPYILHRHPGLWHAPDRFDPDRFAAARPGERAQYAYLPFGGGPRACVGSNLGLLEACICVATLVSRFRIELVPGTRVSTVANLSLRPHPALPMRLIDREGSTG